MKGYNHQPYFDDRRADFIDRFAQFAVIAAREAVQEARGKARAMADALGVNLGEVLEARGKISFGQTFDAAVVFVLGF